jgi:hypothetical protein
MVLSTEERVFISAQRLSELTVLPCQGIRLFAEFITMLFHTCITQFFYNYEKEKLLYLQELF